MTDAAARARRVAAWNAAAGAHTDALLESEERLRLAQEASGVGVFDWDLLTDTLRWSDECKIAFGLPADADVTYDGFRALVDPADHPALDAAVAAALDPDGEGRFSTVYRVLRPDGSRGWIDARGRVTFGHTDAGRRPLRFIGAVLDVTERFAAEARLAESEARFRTITETMPQLVWSARPDGHHDFFNARWYEFTGVPAGSTDGEGWRGLFHPEDQALIDARWSRSLATGEPYDIEYRLRHHTGEYRWVLGRALPVRGADGAIVQWLGTCTDIHAMRTAQEHRQLLLDELNHRVKNTLAIVQSVARQTLRGGQSAADLYPAFEGRLSALASAHDMLTRSDWRETSVADLVEQSRRTCSVEAARWDASGDAAILDPKQTVALAMALHELCTNALKYGALSSPAGVIRLRWTLERELLRLDWTERGGPPVAAPSRVGFGTRLLERALAADLGGRITIAFRPEGVAATLTCRPARAPDQPR